jgi:meiotically up-regulated gene 157 (Mug157) protein
VRHEVERVASALEAVGRTKLANIFRKCFVSTLETTTLLMPNGHTHVFTGTSALALSLSLSLRCDRVALSLSSLDMTARTAVQAI